MKMLQGVTHFSSEFVRMNPTNCYCLNGDITAEAHIEFTTLRRLTVYFRYLRTKMRKKEKHVLYLKILIVHSRTKQNLTYNFEASPQNRGIANNGNFRGSQAYSPVTISVIHVDILVHIRHPDNASLVWLEWANKFGLQKGFCKLVWKKYIIMFITLYAVFRVFEHKQYNDVMSATASQITSVSIVCSPVCSGADQRRDQIP